jgi:hypothetical protein
VVLHRVDWALSTGAQASKNNNNDNNNNNNNDNNNINSNSNIKSNNNNNDYYYYYYYYYYKAKSIFFQGPARQSFSRISGAINSFGYTLRLVCWKANARARRGSPSPVLFYVPLKLLNFVCRADRCFSLVSSLNRSLHLEAPSVPVLQSWCERVQFILTQGGVSNTFDFVSFLIVGVTKETLETPRPSVAPPPQAQAQAAVIPSASNPSTSTFVELISSDANVQSMKKGETFIIIR